MHSLRKHSKKPKVFCVGQGKTGTTSVEKALKHLGYKMGNQVKGERLLEAYVKRDFKAIVNFCKTAEAFQDAPFGFHYTFIALDQAFPQAKFILTHRDSDDQWYQSLCTFHKKLFGEGKRIPTWDDLNRATYRYKGYVAEVRKKVYGIEESEDPYHETKLKAYYNAHNAMILNYFKHKDNLLVLNVAEADAYKKMCTFLDKIGRAHV